MNVKRTISYIFSFFLAFFLFLLALFSVVRFTLAQESYFLSKLESTQYYESAVTDFNKILKQNARPTNFPVEIFDNLVVVSDVSKDMEAYITSEFKEEEATIDTQLFKTRIEEVINTYIQENTIHVSTQTQEAIDSFVKTNVENYATLLKFPYMQYYAKFANLYHKMYLFAAFGLVLLSSALVWGQLRIHKSKRRKKRWISYSLMGSGLLSCTLPLFLLADKTIVRIQIAPEYLYDMLVSSINSMLYYLIGIGLFCILAGILLIYVKIKRKTIKKERDYSKSVMSDVIER